MRPPLRLFAAGALVAVAGCSEPENPGPPARAAIDVDSGGIASATPSPDLAAEEDACRSNLVQIAQAVQAFRADHDGEFPDGFDELLGDYVTDDRIFACPAAVRLGREGIAIQDVIDPALADPISKGYSWELSRTVMDAHGFEEPMTFRRAKLLQMRTVVGDRVPIVRCFHHRGDATRRRCLNLTAQGDIYESDLFWEALWVEQVPRPYLAPRWLAGNAAPLRERLPGRPPSADDRMLDLRPWYNARIQEPWIGSAQGEGLPAFDEALTDGLFVHAGVGFDASGLIQLNGRPADPAAGERGWEGPCYPSEVSGITVARSFETLHALGGVLFAGAPDAVVAELRFRFADGETATVPWRYGIDVANIGFRDGAEDPAVASPRTTVAWTGFSEIGAAIGIAGRLFHLEIANPRPGSEVAVIDFVGGFDVPAPFILALTVDP